MEQNGEANPKSPVGVWQTEFTKLRVPNLYDLLADPFRTCDRKHLLRRLAGPPSLLFKYRYRSLSARGWRALKSSPPQAKAASFTVGDVMEWLRRLSTLGYYGYMLDSLGAYAQCSRLGVTRSF